METDIDIPLPQLSGFSLSQIQRNYVYWRSLGLTGIQAAKRAGYRRPADYMKQDGNPQVMAALRVLQKESKQRYDIDRDKVVEGIVEAIGIARNQDDAMTMIKGWSELARITGVQAAERKQVDVRHVLTDQIATVSDAELLQLLDQKRELVIDGEIVEVGDD